MKNNNSSTIETLQKEINLINQKLEDMHELVHRNHWELQNCIRFYVAYTQIAFKMWQMNIPSIGQHVDIQYFFEDENYDYVSQLFGKQKSKKERKDVLSEHFFFHR
jgi:hypothetical protein